MKSIKKYKLLTVVAILWSVLFSAVAFGQNKITLRIGDPAPELRYSKWIKGTPVKSYEKDRMYVVEFWATWCVPCRIAMPHLSELARKYKATTTFIGVNSGEMTGDKPYEAALPAITKFVDGMGEKMDYDVMADNNESYMSKNWMTAAGLVTIPTTFLIKEGQLIWIGHPDSVEVVIQKVASGSYDMAAFKSKFESHIDPNTAAINKMIALMTPVYDLIKAKKYEEALQLIDQSLQENPSFALQLQSTKFATLLNHVSEKAAMDFAKEWTRENSSGRYMVGKEIAEKNGLSKETYEFAAQLFELKRKEPRALKPVMDHWLAICYSKAGRIKEAIVAEEEALDGAKTALKEGKWPGAISNITVNEYEQALKDHKKLL